MVPIVNGLMSNGLLGRTPADGRSHSQFGDTARALELAPAGGGVDIPLAAFEFEIVEPFLYQYNLLIPLEIECRIEGRSLILNEQLRGDFERWHPRLQSASAPFRLAA
jgi:hypothetical protein